MRADMPLHVTACAEPRGGKGQMPMSRLNEDAPRQVGEGDAAPLILHVSAWHKAGAIGFGVLMTFFALISAPVSHHFTGRHLNGFGIFLLLMALTTVLQSRTERLFINDAGVHHLRWLFPKRACWTEVTGISEHCRTGKHGGWGVLVSKRKGSLFIRDVFTLERPELVSVMTQRWQAALSGVARQEPAHAR